MKNKKMSCWEWFYQQMGQDKVLIDFDEEARQEGYIPNASWQWFGEPGDPPMLVNYDFSQNIWLFSSDYQTAYNNHPPNFDVTSVMHIEER